MECRKSPNQKALGKNQPMDEQEQAVIREFLAESRENLTRLDQELVEWEKQPEDAARLASIFRTIHTIKGTCGFLGFSLLEKIAHQAETLLSQLRDGQRQLNRSLVSLILETVDAVCSVLASIESAGDEGPNHFEDLVESLRFASQSPECSTPSSYACATGPVKSTLPLPAAAGENASPRHDAARVSTLSDASIRVGLGSLDKLMDLVGELVLTRNRILQCNAEREDSVLHAVCQRLNLITAELQEAAMKMRMQPIGTVWKKLPRVVRDLAISLDKEIRLEVDGAETELDRSILEAIKDPLVHLLRNACDHGIEPPERRLRAGKPPQGRISLRACHEGGQVIIAMADDGAGIDIEQVKKTAVEKGLLRAEEALKLTEREAFNLIFQPGFSTAQAISQLSGRGVGMDVVKSNIEQVGGVVSLFSRPGQGSIFRLKIPLTLAIIPGLVVTSANQRFVIPQASLVRLIRLEAGSCRKRIEYIHRTPVYRRHGKLLPVLYLNQVLGLRSAAIAGVVNLVVLQAEGRQFGLIVDAIHDTQEIVVKPLGKQLKTIAVYAGATIMGDGSVALILDVLGIARSSRVLAERRGKPRSPAAQDAPTAIEERLLLFRAGSFERLALPLSLVTRLEEFPLASFEHAGGSAAVQYRDAILPLIPLRAVLEPGVVCNGPAGDAAQVIVLKDGQRSIGLVVDQILDVAADAVTIRHKGARSGILGSVVVGRRVADLLDLSYVLHTAASDWVQDNTSPPPAAGRRLVLVADWNMPEINELELLQRLRQDPHLASLAVVMVTSETEVQQMSIALQAGANEYIMKPFTKEMLLEKLQLAGIHP
jgi:two-component system chemotaxis sensor kinase CheA